MVDSFFVFFYGQDKVCIEENYTETKGCIFLVRDWTLPMKAWADGVPKL